jgi:N-sulfoglucosamine sulfohydrolase
VVFENAFVPVASCGPCRASLATGRYFWNCGSGAFLNGRASNWKGHDNPMQSLPKFGNLIRESGYYAQKSAKTFAFKLSPRPKSVRAQRKVGYKRYGLYVGAAKDQAERKRRHDEIVENCRQEIQRVLAGRSETQPFFFVFGSINIHRPYTPDSGKDLWGIEPDALKGLLPKFLPDAHDVRRDFSDYLGEVLALDLMLGAMLEELETSGELDNTVVILSGDHGIPGVPRGKTNCYDLATRVPLLVRWPKGNSSGRRVEDFVSVMDVGPTLLELSGIKVPTTMDGRSFFPQLTSQKSGWIDPKRNSVIIGRELHFHNARPGNVPYPMRAVRTKDHLYIRNFKPERWPMGNPYDAAELTEPNALYEMGLATTPAYRDLDGSLTKAWMMSQREEPRGKELFHLTMHPRPREELYDLKKDPDQLVNLAVKPEYVSVLTTLRGRVDKVMNATGDPRIKDAFDRLPWVDSTKP